VFLEGNAQEKFDLMSENVRQCQPEVQAILANYCS
jgi:hypothetical protein